MRPPPLDRPTARTLTDADVLRRLDALLADADPEAAAVLDRLARAYRPAQAAPENRPPRLFS